MKRFLVVICSLAHCLVSPVLAQTSKGNYFSSIGLSGSSKSNPNRTYVLQNSGRAVLQISNHKQVNLIADVKAGYFIFNNLAIGINPQLDFAKQVDYSDISDANPNDSIYIGLRTNMVVRTFLFSFNPLVRFYTIKKERFGLFLEGSAGPTLAIEPGKVSTETMNGINIANKTVKTKLFETIPNYKLGIRTNYFFTDNIGIELSAYYQRYIYKDSEKLFANPYNRVVAKVIKSVKSKLSMIYKLL